MVKESRGFVENPHSISQDGNLRVAIEPISNPLNPFYSSSNSISLISRLIHSSIFSRDENNEIVNDLAKEYWYENDGKTIAVVLKDDIKFGEDKAINTSHVENTYKILAHKKYDGNFLSYVENLKGFYPYKIGLSKDFQGIEVLGDKFIKFHFQKADFSNIYSLTFPVLDISDNDVEEFDPKAFKEIEFKNGSGLYEVQDFDGENIRLSCKKDLDNKFINNILISMLNYRDALDLYSNGSIDIVYKYDKTVSFENYYTKRAREYSYNIDNEASTYKFIGFNKDSKIFTDKEMRRAFRDSIDFKDIIESYYGKDIYKFRGIPIYKNSWFNSDVKYKKTNNLKELLEKKYKMKDGFFVDENNEIVTIKLIVQAENEFFQSISERFISDIESFGVKLEIDYLSNIEMLEAVSEGKDFDIYISERYMTEIPRVTDEESFYTEDIYSITKETENIFPYLLNKIQNDVEDPEIKYMSSEWKKFFEENAPYIVLAIKNKTTIVNKNIEGIYINEFLGLDNIENLKNIHFRD